MRTRISRTFLAAVAATAVTASMGVGSSQAATVCKVDGVKITKRKNVSCKTAKTVTRRQVKGQSLPSGWKCTQDSGILPNGKCTKRRTNSSFRYKYVG